MYVSLIITLCLNQLIFYCVFSSPYKSLMKNLSSISKFDENPVFEEFLFQFKKEYLEKYEPRHITIISTSAKYIRQVKEPLLENFPSIICTDAKNVMHPSDFSTGNFVLVFLQDFNEVVFKERIKSLKDCTECKFLFLYEGTIRFRDIRSLFNITAQQNLGYVEFANYNKKLVRIYGHSIAKNCSMEVRLNFFWRPGLILKNVDTWAFLERDSTGCPVSVSTSSFEPKMIIANKNDGSLSITGGREGELVLTIAKALNFAIALRSPSVTERLKYSRKASIVNDVASGLADIGIGRLRPTNDIDDKLVHSVMYDDECITWGIPRIIKWSNNVISVEFTREVWALVGLVFLIGCTIGYVIRKIQSPRKNGDDGTGVEFIAMILDVFTIHLGNPVLNLPIPTGGKFVLIAFLCYAMVLTTAYKTSLASILTTEKGTPMIVDLQGIIKANLSLGGSQYDFNMLRDQMNESEINLKLVERFVVNNNDSETLRRLKLNKDFAFLARGSSLHDEKYKSIRDHESVTFDVFDDCVLAYHTVIIVRKDSFLRRPIDMVIRRLSEAGILEHWDIDKFDADQILKRRNYERFFEERAGRKFQTIFLLYSFCIVLCVLTFLGELIASKINYSKIFYRNGTPKF